MYCSNCGNKVDDNAYVCVNCGVIIKKNSMPIGKPKKAKNENMVTGILSIVFASIGLLFSLIGFIFGDISSVGMYVDFVDRFFFAISYNAMQLLFGIVSLILSLIEIKNNYNKVGLALSLIVFFLILTEFVVIFIY